MQIEQCFNGRLVMEDKIRISGIIFEHGKDDYGLWEGFNLTEDEENQIMEILMNHDTEAKLYFSLF